MSRFQKWRAVLLNDWEDSTYVRNPDGIVFVSVIKIPKPCKENGCPFLLDSSGGLVEYCRCRAGVLQKAIHEMAQYMVMGAKPTKDWLERKVN